MFLSCVLAMLPADPAPPLVPEIPAVARPTAYPGAVLDLSPDGKTAVTSFHVGAHLQHLRFIDLETGVILNDLLLGTANDPVSAKFSPDGKLLAVGLRPYDLPKVVRLIDPRTGLTLREFGGFQDYVEVLRFSPDGTRLVVLERAGLSTGDRLVDTVITLDATTGERVKTEPPPNRVPRLEARTPDGSVTLERTENGKFVVTRPGGKPVTLATDIPDAQYIAAFLTADGKRAVLSEHRWGVVFDTATGEKLRVLRHDTQVVTSAAPAAVGKLLFVAAPLDKHTDRRLEVPRGRVLIWDLAKPELMAVVPGLAGDLCAVQPSADGKRFVAVFGEPGRVRGVEVWDVVGKKRLHALDVEGQHFGQAAVSADGRWVAHAWGQGDDGAVRNVRVWNAETGKVAEEVTRAANEEAGFVAFTPDSERLVTVTTGRYTQWDLATGRKGANWNRDRRDDRPRFALRNYPVSVTAMPAIRGVLVITADGGRRQSYAVTLVTETKEWVLGSFMDHASVPVVSADGRRMVMVAGRQRGGRQGLTLKLNADGSPELMDQPPGHFGHVYDGNKVPAWRRWDADDLAGMLALSPDGSRLYTGGQSHALRVWDTETRAPQATLYAVPPAKPGDDPTDWVIATPAGPFVATPLGAQMLRFRPATPATWFGWPALSAPAAELPHLRDPAKVRESLGVK